MLKMTIYAKKQELLTISGLQNEIVSYKDICCIKIHKDGSK